MEIGRHIRARRRAMNLSQDALARQADVSLSLINQIERGVITDPHYSTLNRIAEAMGVSVAELLEGQKVPLVTMQGQANVEVRARVIAVIREAAIHVGASEDLADEVAREGADRLAERELLAA